MTPLRFQIHTFGCKVNTYDSGLLQSRLKGHGFLEDEGQPQVHIINTCAVTKEATREAVKTARRLKIKNPDSLVVVTGCSAQVDTEEFEPVRGIDLIVANSHKGQLENLIRRYYAGELRDRIHKSNIFKKEDLEPGGGVESAHTRSFLKIQDGCNSFCTYCVIPFARGKSRSIGIYEIVERINALVEQGVKEVVLTGVHIADYRDGEKGLDDLVETVLLKTKVPRLRLTSLEPLELSERLLECYADQRLCRHFHMSIQSANSKVLRDMKRQYDAAAVETSLMTIAEKVPGSFVGMDVIAGFPGESDEEFVDSIDRLRGLPWTRLHVFPYSERPGTFAARRKDQVPSTSIHKRAAMLRELSKERFEQERRAQVGTVKRGLALQKGRLLTRDFWKVELEDQPVSINEEFEIRITNTKPDSESLMARKM